MPDSITGAVKGALKPMNIVGLIVGFVVVNAILELTNLSDWVYYPVASFKAKFAKK